MTSPAAKRAIIEVGPIPVATQYVGGIATLLSQILERWPFSRPVYHYNTEFVHRAYGQTGRLSCRNLGRFLQNAVGILRVTRQHRGAIVHYHASRRLALLKDILICACIRLLTRSRVLLHVHWASLETLFAGPASLRPCQIWALSRCADRLILMSRNIERDLNASAGPSTRSVLSKRARVLYNFAASPGPAVQIRAEGDSLHVLFLGSIGPIKGVYDILQAVAGLTENQRGRVSVTVAGTFETAEEEARFRSAVGRYRLDALVSAPGQVRGSEKDRLLRSADIFMLPSYGEGVPVAMLEAMSYGLALVVSRVGGIPEVVRDGQDGLLLNPGDVRGLTRTLGSLVDDPSRVRRLGCSARQRFECEFTIERFMSGFGAILAEFEGPATPASA